MLYCRRITKEKAIPSGFMLCGDYDTLRSVHQTIHDIVNRSVLLTTNSKWGKYQDFCLGLAFDIRKAYEGQRKTFKHSDPARTDYAVEVSFPHFILQVGILRQAIASMTSSHRMQSNLFVLEALIEESLALYEGTAEASLILERLPVMTSSLHLIAPHSLELELEQDWLDSSDRSLASLVELLTTATAAPYLREFIRN